MEQNQIPLTAWEWLTLIGVICLSGVSVTVFAMTHFESVDVARDRESRLEKRIDRLEELQMETMKGLEIPIPKNKSVYE